MLPLCGTFLELRCCMSGKSPDKHHHPERLTVSPLGLSTPYLREPARTPIRAPFSWFQMIDLCSENVSLNEASGCWEWSGLKTPKGYGLVSIEGKKFRAHRLSYEFNRGKIPDGLFVCHHCDNRCCVNPDHLFVGTNEDNIADMVAKGRQARVSGSQNGSARLSAADVIAIRNARGIKQKELARQYGITQGQVSAIQLRKKWAHI